MKNFIVTYARQNWLIQADSKKAAIEKFISDREWMLKRDVTAYEVYDEELLWTDDYWPGA